MNIADCDVFKDVMSRKTVYRLEDPSHEGPFAGLAGGWHIFPNGMEVLDHPLWGDDSPEGDPDWTRSTLYACQTRPLVAHWFGGAEISWVEDHDLQISTYLVDHGGAFYAHTQCVFYTTQAVRLSRTPLAEFLAM